MLSVEAIFGVTRKELLGGRKHTNIAAARCTAGYLMRTETNMGRQAIAKALRRSLPWASWVAYAVPDRGEHDKEFSKRVGLVLGLAKGAA